MSETEIDKSVKQSHDGNRTKLRTDRKRTVGDSSHVSGSTTISMEEI